MPALRAIVVPGVEIAVEVADGDDPLRLLRRAGGAR